MDYDAEKIATNRIHISFRDCLAVEIESSELSFADLKKEALELVGIVKKSLIDSEKKANENEVA